MGKLWRRLRVGERIRLIEFPPEFGDGSRLHPDTKRVYNLLLRRRRALRVCEVKQGGPWVHCKFRNLGRWESHWLLFNHGGIVRVERRTKPATAQ